jgi:hypothetical protein
MTRMRVLEAGAALVVAFVVLVPAIGLLWKSDGAAAPAGEDPAPATCVASHADALEKKGNAKKEHGQKGDDDEEDGEEEDERQAEPPKPAAKPAPKPLVKPAASASASTPQPSPTPETPCGSPAAAPKAAARGFRGKA